MTVIALRDTPEASTSAVGSIYRVALDAAPAALLIATRPSRTGNSQYVCPRLDGDVGDDRTVRRTYRHRPDWADRSYECGVHG